MKKLPLMFWAMLCLFLTSCDKEISPIEPIRETETDIRTTALTTQLTAHYEDSGIPGFAVTVVKKEGVLYQRAFGQADVAENSLYSNQTIQPIASVSKTFIGLALMKAIEQGHFTLESKINDILPFEIINPHTSDNPILIRHLVTHTAGFQDSEENYELQYYIKNGENALLPTTQVILAYGNEFSDGIPLGEYFKSVYTKEGTLYDGENFWTEGPGTLYNYSNICASLAAYLIEVKTGQSYADFVKQYILEPLGMKKSSFDRSSLDQNNLATLYVSKEYPLPAYSHHSYPDGFLNTSNEDMGLYLMEMIKGSTGNGTLLSNENYTTLFERQSPTNLVLEEGEVHAIFWDLTNNGRIEHSGSDPGVIAFLSFDRTRETGYFIMANINDGGLGSDLGVSSSDATFEQLFKILRMVSEFEKGE